MKAPIFVKEIDGPIQVFRTIKDAESIEEALIDVLVAWDSAGTRLKLLPAKGHLITLAEDVPDLSSLRSALQRRLSARGLDVPDDCPLTELVELASKYEEL